MLCKSRILPYIDKKTDIPGIYLPGISVFYFYAIHLICYFMYTYSINSFSSLASSILEPMTQRRPVYSGWPSRISYSSGTISKYIHVPSWLGSIPFARRIIPYSLLSAESAFRIVSTSSFVYLRGVSLPQLVKTSSA